MRVAAVDLGTNTTRLLVADVVDGNVDEVVASPAITRLGEGVDARRRLLPAAIARVRNALSDYRRTLERLGAERTLLVATSAVRDAENGEAFLGEIEWSYGFVTRLVTGDEEAELTRAECSPRRGRSCSTSAAARPSCSSTIPHSLDMGSVRFTERFVHTDPPTRDEVDDARAAVRAASSRSTSHRSAIGVAGTVTTLAALDLGLDAYDRERVHGHRLSLRARERNSTGSPRCRWKCAARCPALDPERAPVIVAGAVILAETLARFGLDAIEVSERDILDGIALAAAELPEPEEGAAPPGAYTCC